MRKLAIAVAVSAGLMPVVLSAANLTLNGQLVSGITVQSLDFSSGNLDIVVTGTEVSLNGGNGGGGDGGGGDGGGGDGGGGDIPASCDGVPSGFSSAHSLSWGSNPVKTLVELGGDAKYSAFTTTGNSGYLGQIGFAAVTGGSDYNKRMWISHCPGGPALPESKCDRNAAETATISWAQNSTARSRCHLETNTQYYLNYEAESCSGYRCDVNIAGSTNGNP